MCNRKGNCNIHISNEVREAVGSLQICAGHLSGCEAAVHTMHQVFQFQNTEALILVNACNAFSSLNRETALRNILHLCPPLAKVLINTYRDDIQPFIDGDTLSRGNYIQGDSLAMAMYTVAITPLIKILEDDETKQVWFADDATAGGGLTDLKKWWDLIVKRGPAYGYCPNPTKTCLVVKDEYAARAEEVFQRSSFIVFYQLSQLEGRLVQQRTLLRIAIACGCNVFANEYESVATGRFRR